MTQEDTLKVRLRRGAVQDALLATVATVGFLAVALAAPNVAGMLGRTLNRHMRFGTRTSGQRLVKAGYLTLVENDGKKFYKLTKAGEAELARVKTYEVPRPKKWDGRWRIVCFDIAQARSAQRTLLRQKLQQIGFERLQDSVWVFPYDCEDLVKLLKTDFGVGKEVLYIIADGIENDRGLRGRFGLK